MYNFASPGYDTVAMHYFLHERWQTRANRIDRDYALGVINAQQQERQHERNDAEFDRELCKLLD